MASLVGLPEPDQSVRGLCRHLASYTQHSKPPLYLTSPSLLSAVIFSRRLTVSNTRVHYLSLLWPTSFVAVLVRQELVQGLTIGRGLSCRTQRQLRSPHGATTFQPAIDPTSLELPDLQERWFTTLVWLIPKAELELEDTGAETSGHPTCKRLVAHLRHALCPLIPSRVQRTF